MSLKIRPATTVPEALGEPDVDAATILKVRSSGHRSALCELLSPDCAAMVSESPEDDLDDAREQVRLYIEHSIPCGDGAQKQFMEHHGWSSSPEMVRLFAAYVEAGYIRPNECDATSQLYPLELAILRGSTETVDHLLENGADVSLLPGNPDKRDPNHPHYVAGISDIVRRLCKPSAQAEMDAVIRRHTMAAAIAAHSSASAAPGNFFIADVDDLIHLHCNSANQAEVRAVFRRHAMAAQLDSSRLAKRLDPSPSPARSPAAAPAALPASSAPQGSTSTRGARRPMGV